jgi:L-iditol 2-dehydrogenase
MRAVALTDVAKLELIERELPKIDEHSILLKVKAVGICGSDLRIFNHGDLRVTFPRIMGHEIAGEIAEVGKSIDNFEVGDRVALGAHIPCGLCKYCNEGMGHHCIEGWTIGYQFDGGFAEYVRLDKRMVQNGSIAKFGKDTSFEVASLSEPFSCVMNGLKQLSIKKGDTITIFGAGAIGLMFMVAAQKMGAGKIIVVQRSAPRRRIAKQLGADLCVDPTVEDEVSKILDETQGYGCDKVIVTAPSNEVQNAALSCVRKRGEVLFFARLAKSGPIELDTNKIVSKELSLYGVRGASKLDHSEAMEWIDTRLVDLSPFVTGRFKLSETEKAFFTSQQKSGLKSVVIPDL